MELLKYNTSDFRPTSFRSMVDQFFNDEFHGGSVATFTPKVDVAETDSEFELQLSIPGIKKADVNIEVEKDQLIVSGERKFEEETDKKNFKSIESYYGSFRRTFSLPDVINRDGIVANYQDGILTVSLPKDEEKTTKKLITVE